MTGDYADSAVDEIFDPVGNNDQEERAEDGTFTEEYHDGSDNEQDNGIGYEDEGELDNENENVRDNPEAEGELGLPYFTHERILLLLDVYKKYEAKFSEPRRQPYVLWRMVKLKYSFPVLIHFKIIIA